MFMTFVADRKHVPWLIGAFAVALMAGMGVLALGS
jgi:hypothetical protein